MSKNSTYTESKVPFRGFRGITYFKQAWNLIKQEKLFSSIYILGTGLSIMIVMILAIVLYLKLGNIYPETNRNRMLAINIGAEKSEDNLRQGGLSLPVIETILHSVEIKATITCITSRYNPDYVQSSKEKSKIQIEAKYVDTNYWKVFPFRFINGKAFTEADFQSGVKTTVIAESLARKLFGTTEVTGKYVYLNFIPYRICGVVKDASFITPETFSHLWMPYTTYPDYRQSNGELGTIGPFHTFILVPPGEKSEDIQKEVTENIKKYNSTLKDWKFTTYGQPDKHWQFVLRDHSSDPDFTRIILTYAIIILILLLIPAVSLMGMVESRMERRLAETGVRRAFGAPVGTLMTQIVTENFLFTFIGGITGLVFSFIIFSLGKDWMMQMGKNFAELPPQGTETIIYPEMLLNIVIFAITLGISFLLNLLCSLIPAWKASHREIIYSLNAKK